MSQGVPPQLRLAASSTPGAQLTKQPQGRLPPPCRQVALLRGQAGGGAGKALDTGDAPRPGMGPPNSSSQAHPTQPPGARPSGDAAPSTGHPCSSTTHEACHTHSGQGGLWVSSELREEPAAAAHPAGCPPRPRTHPRTHPAEHPPHPPRLLRCNTFRSHWPSLAKTACRSWRPMYSRSFFRARNVSRSAGISMWKGQWAIFRSCNPAPVTTSEHGAPGPQSTRGSRSSSPGPPPTVWGTLWSWR